MHTTTSQKKKSADIQIADHAVVGLHDEYEAGFVDPPHVHDRLQILYAIAGVMKVVTPDATFIIPPLRALIIPTGVLHEVSCRGAVALRTLYIDQALQPQPTTCEVLEVTDFLSALVLEVVRFSSSSSRRDQPRERSIVGLLLGEIAASKRMACRVSMPADPRLLRVCRSIITDPSDAHEIDHWAAVACMGRRTFTRRFRDETGMAFAGWRQQVRLMEALSLLAVGRSITSVALDVGYDSPSAFSAMFHRAFGASPSQYLSH